jgi:hypothetical protein
MNEVWKYPIKGKTPKDFKIIFQLISTENNLIAFAWNPGLTKEDKEGLIPYLEKAIETVKD